MLAIVHVSHVSALMKHSFSMPALAQSPSSCLIYSTLFHATWQSCVLSCMSSQITLYAISSLERKVKQQEIASQLWVTATGTVVNKLIGNKSLNSESLQELFVASAGSAVGFWRKRANLRKSFLLTYRACHLHLQQHLQVLLIWTQLTLFLGLFPFWFHGTNAVQENKKLTSSAQHARWLPCWNKAGKKNGAPRLG